MTTYTHTISDITSINNGTILLTILHTEITTSIADFLGINPNGVTYYFHKSTTWSSGNITTLTSVITAHTGTPPPGGDDISSQTGMTLVDPGSGTNEITLISPDPVSSSYIITLPASVGSSGHILKTTDGIGTLGWFSSSNDVTAAATMTNNTLLQGDGGAKGIQDSTITVTNDNELSGIAQLDVDNIRVDGSTISATSSSNLFLKTTGTSSIYLQPGFGGTKIEGIIKMPSVFTITPAGGSDKMVIIDALGFIGSQAITLGTVTAVTGTAPIISSGGATSIISILPATGSTDGSLSAADKTTLDRLEITATQVLAGESAGIGQGSNAIAVGLRSGNSGQAAGAVSIGYEAGKTLQGVNSVALGTSAGATTQSGQAIAIGNNAASLNQNSFAIAIGAIAAQNNQGAYAVSLGNNAGYNSQGLGAVAVGPFAASVNQGEHSIVINSAGTGTTLVTQQNTQDNTIVLNASTAAITNPPNAGLYIKPVRDSTTSGKVLTYDATSGEITFDSTNVEVTAAANMTANTLLQGDGGAKGIQDSTITVTNDDELGAIQDINILASADANTHFGYQSRPLNQGVNNTSIGHQANRYVNVAPLNTTVAIGGFANANLDGVSGTRKEQVAIGFESMVDRPGTGDGYNTAVGYRTLKKGGQRNVAIGHTALEVINGGQRNTGVGMNALCGLISGSFNTAIGYDTGCDILGDNNICIGYKCRGYAADGQTFRVGEYGTGVVGPYITRAFIRGIHSVAPAAGDIQSVIIDDDGQLGSQSIPTGDVTAAAAMTDKTIIIGDGGGKGVQDTTITVTNDDELSNVQYVDLLQDTLKNTWYGYTAGNHASLTTAEQCVSFGDGALASVEAGTKNTALGYQALNSAVDNNGNVAVGCIALKSCDTGASNVALGLRALNLLESGNLNIAIGVGCMEFLETGSSNICIGAIAGGSLDGSQSGNIMIGDQLVGDYLDNDTIRIGRQQTRAFIKGIHNITPANPVATHEMVIVDSAGQLGSQSIPTGDVTAASNMTANTLLQGDGGGKGIQDSTITVTNDDELSNVQYVDLLQDTLENTWYGYTAGNHASLTTAEKCVSIGDGALASITAGVKNTAVGWHSCAVLGTGSNNTALGDEAMEKATEGIGNCAIGVRSLNDLTTANDCIAIGKDALGQIETGDSNIGIGTTAGYNLNLGTETRNIMIANPGISGDMGTIRLGQSGGFQDLCFIAGIYNVTPGAGSNEMVIVDTDGQLGSQALPVSSSTGISTDNRLALFDGIGGKTIKQSTAIIDTSGALSGITQLNVDNLRLDGNTISSTNVNGVINITPNGTGAVTLGSTSGIAATTIQSGTGGLIQTSTDEILIDSVGVLELNSSTGIIGIGNDAVAQAINIGTGAAARTVTIGNNTGATSLVLNAGTGAVNIGSNAIARTITIGNTTGASALVLNSGTSGITATGVHSITPTNDTTTEMVIIDTNGELGSTTRFPELINYFVDLTTTTYITSGSAFLDIPVDNTPTLLAGDYLLSFSYCWNLESSGNDFISRITWDVSGVPIVLGSDTGTYLNTHRQEPKDHSGNNPSDQQFAWSKPFIIKGVSAGIKEITLEVRGNNGIELNIWDITYILNRIG